MSNKTIYNISCSIEGGQPRRYADSVYRGQIKVDGQRALTETEARELVAMITSRGSARRVERTLSGYAVFTAPKEALAGQGHWHPGSVVFPGKASEPPVRSAVWDFEITEPYCD